MFIQLSQKLEKSFSFIIVFLPFFFIFGSAILNTVIVALNIFFLIHIVINKNFNFIEQNKYYFALILIYLLFQITNNLINENYEYFIKSISYLRFLTLPIIFKYFFQIIEIDFVKISKLYLFLTLFIIFDLFFQFSFDANFFGFKPGLYNLDLNLYERYSGIFNQELILGSYLSSIGFLSISIFYFFNSNKKYLFLLLLGLLFISIFLTGERSSFLNFLISIFFIFVFVKELRKSLIVISFFITICSVIGISLNDQLKLRYFDYPLGVILQNPIASSNKSIESVEKKNISKFSFKTSYSNFINNTHWGLHYKTAGQMFIDKPISGHGFKQFRKKCKNYSYLFSEEDLRGSTVKNGCSTHPHHYILEILSEQGLIGLLIFLVFVIFVTKDIMKSNFKKEYVLVLFCIILGYMLPIKPSGSIISTWFSSIFWLMLSFGYIKNKI